MGKKRTPSKSIAVNTVLNLKSELSDDELQEVKEIINEVTSDN